MDPIINDLFRLRQRVKVLEDKSALMAAVWDGQRTVLLERIIRLEEQCQTNTATKTN